MKRAIKLHELISLMVASYAVSSRIKHHQDRQHEIHILKQLERAAQFDKCVAHTHKHTHTSVCCRVTQLWMFSGDYVD